MCASKIKDRLFAKVPALIVLSSSSSMSSSRSVSPFMSRSQSTMSIWHNELVEQSNINTTYLLNKLYFLTCVEMGSKIKEISRRLDNISTRQAKLGLKMDLGVGHGWERFASGRRASTWERPPTTSLINEAVQGRDKERKDIVDLLLKDEAGESNFGVLPIVGLGGTGKTTLAQLVCKDEGIMKHFDPIAWVCISEESDVVKISEAILRALSHNQSTDLNDFNKVQQTLGDMLTRKKFLLVLDDVWNINHDEQWNTLQTPFKYGEKGSKIIITTRDANVARTMRAYDSRYTLQPLSDDDFTKWCGGLPLAAKVLGGLLRSKLHDHSWEDLLKNEIWRLPSEKRDILRVLRLSYHHLPSHLKRCFSYCALFPKDYEFEKKELVLLWMAEGFIHQSKGDELQMEDLGANYFDEMLSRSFFQQSSNNKSNFVMHDLIHDLAKDIAQEICFNLNNDKTKNDKMKHLRTLLPYWIGDLKLLRYLNLSHTAVKCLPESVSCLYNLQVLMLCNCINLIKLPMNIGNLINLRHLNINGSIQLKEMPSRLTMEWSSDFEDSRNERNELEVFKLLQPHESLKKLVVACYGGLTFPNWLGDHSFTKMEHLSLKSCKKLARLPPLGRLPLLKELHIEGMNEITCIGDEFYGEIEALFPCLRELTVKKCPELIDLPSQLLSFLACLELESLGRSLIFLTVLRIANCSKLVSFPDASFPPMVRALRVTNCEDLKSLPHRMMNDSCTLEYLEIKGCPSLIGFPKGKLPFTLKQLRIQECEKLDFPPPLRHFHNLAKAWLVLSHCSIPYTSSQGGSLLQLW
ncbi:unnamed protein product, partial [Vitis vinifera]